MKTDYDICPYCKKDLRYTVKGKGAVFSKLIGIEVRGKYDGVSYWECPECKAVWDRWTGEKVDSF